MESLKIYIKMTMKDYKDKLAKAHQQQGTVGSHPLCTIDSATALCTFDSATALANTQ